MVKQWGGMYRIGSRFPWLSWIALLVNCSGSLSRLIEIARYIGDQRTALFEVSDSTHQHDDDERPVGVDDSCVVMDLGDLAGFVRDENVLWHAGGNALVEFLTFKDFDHLRRGFCVDRFAVCDRDEQCRQAAGGRRVVEPFVECLLILDTALDVHTVSMKRRDRGANVVDAEL